MAERIKWINNLDENQNGIIGENVYRNFKNVVKNPEGRKDLVEAIDNNQEILLLLKPAVEDKVTNILLEWKKDKESIKTLQIYALKYTNIDENTIWPINGEYNGLSESLFVLIEQEIDPLVFIWKSLEEYTIKTFDGFSEYGVVFSPEVMNVYWDKTNSIQSIYEKTTPKDRLDKLLSSNIWKQIWSDSLRYWDFGNICNAVWKDVNTMEDKDKLEVKEFYDKYEESINRIKHLESHLYGNIITWGKTIYKREQLEEDTDEIIKDIAYEYGKLAMKTWINKDEIVRLSIWVIDIKLDFSNMEWGNYDEKFDDIYRETNIEHFIDGVETAIQDVRENPEKRAVDVIAILAWWTAAAMYTIGTEWLWILQAWVAYTAIHEAVKTTWYGLIHMNEKWVSAKNFKSGYDEGIWYSNADGEYLEDSHFLIGKWFEYTVNIWLFAIFKGGDKVSKVVWLERLNERLSVWNIRETMKGISKKEQVSLLWEKIAFEWSKVWIEASLFTALHTGMWSIEPALINFLENGWNIEQAKEVFLRNLDELNKPENLIQSLIYNYMFISAIKLAWSPINPIVNNYKQKRYVRLEDNTRKITEIREKVLTENEKLVQEIQRLESKGYSITLNEIKWEPKLSIIWPRNERIDFLWDLEFTGLKVILKNLNKLWREYYITQLDTYKVSENVSKKPEDEVKWRNIGKKWKKESGRGNKVSKSWLSLIDKTLQDVLTGFRIWTDKLTEGFQTLIWKDFSKIWDIGKVKEEVSKQIKVEVESYLKKEKLEPKETEFIRKKTEEFELALTEKILRDKIQELTRKQETNPLSERDKSQLTNLTKELQNSIFSSKYWNPEVMNRLMGEFVERLDGKLIDKITKEDFITKPNDTIPR